MKKKVLLTIGLVLLIGLGIYFIYTHILGVISYIDLSNTFPELNNPIDIYITRMCLYLIFALFSLAIITYLLFSIWKKEIKEMSYSYSDYKLNKEKKRKQKVEQKKKKLEEKINKLK